MKRSSTLRELAAGITAQNIMTPDPITVAPNNTIEEAADLLYENGIRHLPVVDEGRLIGMLSERDIRAFTLPVSDPSAEPGSYKHKLKTRVRSVYKSDFVALGPEAELQEVVEVLVEEKIGAIPIVSPRDFRLVGIISYIDVLKHIQSLAELEVLASPV